MDIAGLIGWGLVLILFVVILMGLFWMRGRSLRLEKMLEEGDVGILNVGNIRSEVLNHFPEGSQIIPYTPYIADSEDVDSQLTNQ